MTADDGEYSLADLRANLDAQLEAVSTPQCTWPCIPSHKACAPTVETDAGCVLAGPPGAVGRSHRRTDSEIRRGGGLRSHNCRVDTVACTHRRVVRAQMTTHRFTWLEVLKFVRARDGPFNWMLLEADIKNPKLHNAGSQGLPGPRRPPC